VNFNKVRIYYRLDCKPIKNGKRYDVNITMAYLPDWGKFLTVEF